ncbi:MAG: zf-HC2 domain-containing protein [Myxococcota bacterium]
MQTSLSDFLDGELSAVSSWSVRRHLTACAACRASYANLHRTVAALKGVGARRRS